MMGYFSTGTEGADWEARWCYRCVHYPEVGECPVMLLHSLWNYDQCAAANDRHEGREPQDKASEAKLIALETLISCGESGLGNDCQMFYRKPAPEPTATQTALRELREYVLPEVAR